MTRNELWTSKGQMGQLKRGNPNNNVLPTNTNFHKPVERGTIFIDSDRSIPLVNYD
jgi:hypothetical protein